MLSVLLLFGLPVSGAGQSAIDLRAGVAIGFVDPSGTLANAPLLDDPSAVLSYGDLGASMGIGVDVDVRVGERPFGLRLGAFRSFTNVETGRWGCGLDDTGLPRPCPSILIEPATEMTVTTATLSLVGDVRVGWLTIHPVVGVGAQRWSYLWDARPSGSFSLAPGEYRDYSANLYGGLGAEAVIGAIRLEAECGEHRARASATRPHRLRVLSLAASTSF